MSPIDYTGRGENGWGAAAYYRDCKDARCVYFNIISDNRYQRDELTSVEACDELKRRTDLEIAEKEKMSAIRRKIIEEENKPGKQSSN